MRKDAILKCKDINEDVIFSISDSIQLLENRIAQVDTITDIIIARWRENHGKRN